MNCIFEYHGEIVITKNLSIIPQKGDLVEISGKFLEVFYRTFELDQEPCCVICLK